MNAGRASRRSGKANKKKELELYSQLRYARAERNRLYKRLFALQRRIKESQSLMYFTNIKYMANILRSEAYIFLIMLRKLWNKTM